MWVVVRTTDAEPAMPSESLLNEIPPAMLVMERLEPASSVTSFFALTVAVGPT